MKTLFTLFFILFYLLGAAQNPAPQGADFKTIQSPIMRYNTVDSTLYIYMGATLGWMALANNPTLQLKIDSIAAAKDNYRYWQLMHDEHGDTVYGHIHSGDTLNLYRYKLKDDSLHWVIVQIDTTKLHGFFSNYKAQQFNDSLFKRGLRGRLPFYSSDSGLDTTRLIWDAIYKRLGINALLPDSTLTVTGGAHITKGILADKFKKNGGSATQFLMADGATRDSVYMPRATAYSTFITSAGAGFIARADSGKTSAGNYVTALQLALKVAIADTSSMLSKYARKQSPTFTGTVAGITSAMTNSVAIADTATMLSKYPRKANSDLTGSTYLAGTIKVVGTTDDNSPDSLITVNAGTFRRSATTLFANASHNQAQSTITGLADSLLARYTKTQANYTFVAYGDSANGSGAAKKYASGKQLNTHAALTTTAHGGLVAIGDTSTMLSKYARKNSPTFTGTVAGITSAMTGSVAKVDSVGGGSGKYATGKALQTHTLLTTTAHGGLVAISDTATMLSKYPRKANSDLTGSTHLSGTIKVVGTTDDASPDSIITVNAGTFRRSATSLFASASHNQVQSTITGLSDSLLARYTKTQANYTFVPKTLTITATAPITIAGTTSADLSTNRTIAISAATQSVPGSMSAADKTKLDGIASGATANTGTVTSVATGLGLSGGTITTTGTLLLDTANASVISRERAAKYYVVKNAAITGATKTKITYDTKGLVTSGADATTADIADATNKRYVTDAQATVIGNTSGTNSGNQTLTIGGTTAPTIALSGSNTATFASSTGITLGQSAGTITVTNSAPDTYAAVTKGNLTENITGLEFDNTRQVIGGAAQLSLTTGYGIPTTTQIGNIHASGSDNQTSIVGITGTTAQFNTALSDADFATGGGTASGTNTGDNATNSQYSGLVTNANHSGDATGSAALTLATVNANVGTYNGITVNAKGLVTGASSGNYATGGGSATGTNTGDNAVNSNYSGLVTMTYPGSGIALSGGSSWGTSITNNSANWNTAYGWGNHAGLYRGSSWVPAWGDISGTVPTWNQNTTGSSYFSYYVYSQDRNRATMPLPNTLGLAVQYDFANSAVIGGTRGDFAGVMTWAPYTGTTTSGGDCSYQIGVVSTVANGGSARMVLRNGVNSTWNPWQEIMTSSNIDASVTASTHAGLTAATGASGHLTSTDWNTFNGKAPASGSANYIQNQSAAAQANSSLWVDGIIKTTKGAAYLAEVNMSQWGDDTDGLKLIQYWDNSGIEWRFKKGASNLMSFTTVGVATFASTVQATTGKFTNLTDGYVPYHVNDASGLVDSPIYANGTNVGIGTIDPKNKFVISDAGARGLEIGVNATYDVNLACYNRSTAAYIPFMMDASRFAFLTGNVGIGTTNPGAYKLYVNGTGYFSGELTAASLKLAAATDGHVLKIHTDGTVYSESITTFPAYTMPATDGSNGQVLGTNGSGAVTWVAKTPVNTSVQALSGTSPAWNVNSGVNATLSISGTTTISMSNLVAGTTGNITIRPHTTTNYTVTISNGTYTNKITPMIRAAANQLTISAFSNPALYDIFSWYYDGNVVIWSGTKNVN